MNETTNTENKHSCSNSAFSDLLCCESCGFYKDSASPRLNPKANSMGVVMAQVLCDDCEEGLANER